MIYINETNVAHLLSYSQLSAFNKQWPARNVLHTIWMQSARTSMCVNCIARVCAAALSYVACEVGPYSTIEIVL